MVDVIEEAFNALLWRHATVFLDPDDPAAASPIAVEAVMASYTLNHWPVISTYYGAISTHRGIPIPPVACLLPCVRFVQVVSPSFHPRGFPVLAFIARPTHFNDLADMHATLGRFYWVMF